MIYRPRLTWFQYIEPNTGIEITTGIIGEKTRITKKWDEIDKIDKHQRIEISQKSENETQLRSFSYPFTLDIVQSEE